MPYDSEIVDDTLMKELYSINPDLAEEGKIKKKIILLEDWKNKQKTQKRIKQL